MKRLASTPIAILLGATLSLAAEPTVITGKATSAVDGDTFVLNATNVYLLGVQAPELDQPYGEKARDALGKLVAGRIVRVQVHGRDKAGGIHGVVYLGRVCVNTAMLQRGHAWYNPESFASKSLARLQADAKQRKRGLWADDDAVAPWTWREQHPLEADTAAAKAVRPDFDPAKPGATAARPPAAHPTGYWLNTNSGTRHNPKCQYFGKTKNGRPCGPREGTACKTCGG